MASLDAVRGTTDENTIREQSPAETAMSNQDIDFDSNQDQDLSGVGTQFTGKDDVRKESNHVNDHSKTE